VGDTVVLAPLEEIVADFEVSPTWLGYDKLDLTVLDRSRNAEGRIWFIDRVEQDDSGSVLYYSISEDADSVVVGIVAFNNTCSDTAERVVPVLHHMLTFPNVFTPSLNDNNRFGPIGYNVTDYELWIYDRRGNLVFHGTDVTEMWDGTCNGAPCRQESYTYTCRYTTPTNDRLSMTGTVTLLR
jgi:gliding motility-associated-like protein